MAWVLTAAPDDRQAGTLSLLTGEEAEGQRGPVIWGLTFALRPPPSRRRLLQDTLLEFPPRTCPPPTGFPIHLNSNLAPARGSSRCASAGTPGLSHRRPSRLPGWGPSLPLLTSGVSGWSLIPPCLSICKAGPTRPTISLSIRIKLVNLHRYLGTNPGMSKIPYLVCKV